MKRIDELSSELGRAKMALVLSIAMFVLAIVMVIVGAVINNYDGAVAAMIGSIGIGLIMRLTVNDIRQLEEDIMIEHIQIEEDIKELNKWWC